jgi:fructokinase
MVINHVLMLLLFLFFPSQNEEKLREALKFSNACGAICTTKKGAIPALPTVATAQDLIAKAN